MNYSPEEIIAFAEKMFGSQLTKYQKTMIRELSDGRLYFQSARGCGKSFLTQYLGQWATAEEDREPTAVPYSLSYDSLMRWASV